ncbi:VOC family protein [Haloechinothrix sp. LS1_15]|uniref:VOC family protein n=1 Tax=Haloechinothrix sp. LS1_15 TaxID=2652248 RepID=UPI002945274A|nr:VOC family protein [Haloechinothrix sp. LS1_15]MDV6014247.1 VOC family protein [Haloechinothrix sp. LS1_15]
MPNPVVHFEIGGRDLDRQRSFYRDLFGWTFDTADPKYALISSEDSGIGGGLMQVDNDMTPYVAVYVAVDDLEAALGKAVALGGKRVLGPTPIPDVGTFAVFTDPDGNPVGLFHEG